jgi:hypothetical protein
MKAEKISSTWATSYHQKLVAYVVKTKHGKFLPLIATCYESPGENDCSLWVEFKASKQDTLEAALALIDKDADKFHHVFREPIASEMNGMGCHWLIALVEAEKAASAP